MKHKITATTTGLVLPGIAAFDVINEPEGSPWNAPHRAFQKAIRKEDPDRMIVTEWSGYEWMKRDFPINAV